MCLLSFKLIILAIFLCSLQAHANEDKSAKNLKADLKAKYAKEQPSAAIVETSTENLSTESISVLGISVPPEYENDTVQIDHHTYYNSTFYIEPETAKSFYIEMKSYPEITIHEMLSSSHRQATTVGLKFEFPFYGSPLNNVTIATGGFLYMGDYLHNWIAATQYVAPLMANFDTSQSKDSLIKYADNGTAFTVEWEKVFIKDRVKDGAFTFQVTLFKSGDITFVYKEIPFPVSNISDASHPVKVGISDAYVLERSLFFVRRKTIYEYHRIDMLKKNITSNTALYFTALPTCLSYKDCNTCLSADPKMECMWCETVKRCSDGVDRLRQNWITNGCSLNTHQVCPAQSAVSTEKSASSAKSSSSSSVETSTNSLDKPSTYKHDASYDVDGLHHNDISLNKAQEPAHYIQATEKESITTSSISVGAIVTIALFIAALFGGVGWMVYAYKFPQTPSGQFLIKYRPSQWTMRKDNSAVNTNPGHL